MNRRSFLKALGLGAVAGPSVLLEATKPAVSLLDAGAVDFTYVTSRGAAARLSHRAIVTRMGTAAGFTGQGPLATASVEELADLERLEASLRGISRAGLTAEEFRRAALFSAAGRMP